MHIKLFLKKEFFCSYPRVLFQKGMLLESTYYGWAYVLVKWCLSVPSVLVSNQIELIIAGKFNVIMTFPDLNLVANFSYLFIHTYS